MNILYHIFIYPIYITIESIFVLAGGFEHPLFSIFIVSLVVSLLCLPFYLQADKYYEKDTEIKKQLEPKIKSIKANFKGKERFLMLNELYKQNGYSLFNQLKTILGLIIQILVFVSAYKFFTDITLEETQSIWFIKDILKPDSAFVINNIKINILPIIMTIINIISAEVYLKIIKSNKRINSYIIALAFLIILYKSPSILVIYWTFNNIFSLIKNLIMLYIRRNKNVSEEKREEEKSVPKQLTITMILCCLSFTLLYSVFIPFQVFPNISENEKLYYINYVLNCLYTCFGMFFLYPMVLYYVIKPKHKIIFTTITVSFLISAISNFLFTNIDVCSVKDDFSLLSDSFEYGNIFINIILIIIYAYITFIIYKLLKQYKVIIILKLVFVIFVSVILMCIYYGINVECYNDEMGEISFCINDINIYKNLNKISLSKTNKNVILIFLDSASASAMNLMLTKNPEIFNEFDGFTFYSDVKALFPVTMLSLPSLLGGYEYTVDKINENNFNNIEIQSMYLLPVIFANIGYNINFVDNSISLTIDENNELIKDGEKANQNYENTFDILLNVFNNKKINVFVPQYNRKSKFIQKYPKFKYEFVNIKHSIFYTVCLTLHPFLKNILYEDAEYLTYEYNNINNLYFLREISNMYFWQKYTTFDSEKNTYTLFYNYLPFTRVFNFKQYNMFAQKRSNNPSYNSFIIAISILNKYMHFLKQNGAYDNSKIIIASDHGSRSELYNLGKGEEYPTHNDAIILYKDFNQRGELKIDNSDLLLPIVPTMVLGGIVDNPINPFSGNVIKELSEQERHKYPICGENACYYDVHNVISKNTIGTYCKNCNKYFKKLDELPEKVEPKLR